MVVQLQKLLPYGGGGNHRMSSGTFSSTYLEGDELGSGAFSVVHDAIHKMTGQTYAVKIIPSGSLTESDEERLEEEIAILKKLDHPNIIRLHDVYHEDKTYYLVTEKMKGGELFDRIVDKVCYNEKEARDMCLTLFNAIKYMHDKKIVHRDLKPENLLLLNYESDTEIKIADFGFAKQCKHPASLTTWCGTNGYMAPEIYNRTPYGLEVDMYSLGVIMYMLLGGYAPFDENNDQVRKEQVCNGVYAFHDEYWSHISASAKDLIAGLLEVDPSKRLTARQVLKHEWFAEEDELELAEHDLEVNLEALRRFNAKRKFKAATLAIMCSSEFLAAVKGTTLSEELKKRTVSDCSSVSTVSRQLSRIQSQSSAAA